MQIHALRYTLPVEATDEELMLRYRDGDAAAFDLLYARHKNGLRRYVARLVRESGPIDELLQDVWMNLIRTRATYTVQAKFTTFIYRVAHNRVIDHVRRQASAKVVSLHGHDDDEDNDVFDPPDHGLNEPARQLNAKRQAQRLLELLERLPAAQREAFLLREEADMSVDEIAAATGVDRETAKSRLRYAVAKLTRGMQDWW